MLDMEDEFVLLSEKNALKISGTNRFYYIQVLHINTECKLTKYV
jgi:hypothetical protein